MNILSHCISQVPHRKQMAYSNSDYLRRFLLTEVLFPKAWAEWRETKQPVQQPQIRKLGAARLSLAQAREGRGCGEQQLGVPRREGGHRGGGSVSSSPHERVRTKKCIGCAQLPTSNPLPKLSISKIQTKIHG